MSQAFSAGPFRAAFAGAGSFLPGRAVSNHELAQRVDTSDEWIRERTGIRQRFLAEPGDTCARIGAEAGRRALRDAGIEAAEVDAVLVATSTPDQAFPATAVRIQSALGMTTGFGMDLAAACSGFIYAVSVADAMIRAGTVRTVLVIGAEMFSRIIDWSDRTTCVLFGDGAGAMVFRAAASDGPGLLSTHLHSDGSTGDLLYVDGVPGRHEQTGFLRMNGREVFRHAVAKLASAVDEALRANGLEAADVDWLVPHQANKRIIDATARKLGLSDDRVVLTVDRHANTSAASIPLAFDEAYRQGRIRRGDLVLLEALGGGLTWGSALLRI